MTGVKLLQLMRRSSRLKNTPVMLVTGNLLETKRLEDNGSTKLANDFLSKPFNTRDLIKRVKALADSAPVKRQRPSPKSHPTSNKKP
jgi:DNA-binding response OmpR family regulator